ncbi:hypothetical protein HY624_02435 [Candidatus Uhrbacteria bacterium]|nr:hypothetical protein [Candidatus Uhrbacteria bacterium]
MLNESVQLKILQAELEATQKQIDKYDQFSMTTRTWAVTLWVASLGWAFQGHRAEILLLSIALLFIFWSLDAINKSFRRDYKERRHTVGGLLARLFQEQSLTANTSAPQFPEHNPWKILTSFFAVHMALPYALLTVVSLVLYFAFPI